MCFEVVCLLVFDLKLLSHVTMKISFTLLQILLISHFKIFPCTCIEIGIPKAGEAKRKRIENVKVLKLFLM